MPDDKEVAALAEQLGCTWVHHDTIKELLRFTISESSVEALASVALAYVEERRNEDRKERLRLKEEIRMIREGEEPK